MVNLIRTILIAVSDQYLLFFLLSFYCATHLLAHSYALSSLPLKGFLLFRIFFHKIILSVRHLVYFLQVYFFAVLIILHLWTSWYSFIVFFKSDAMLIFVSGSLVSLSQGCSYSGQWQVADPTISVWGSVLTECRIAQFCSVSQHLGIVFLKVAKCYIFLEMPPGTKTSWLQPCSLSYKCPM